MLQLTTQPTAPCRPMQAVARVLKEAADGGQGTLVAVTIDRLHEVKWDNLQRLYQSAWIDDNVVNGVMRLLVSASLANVFVIECQCYAGLLLSSLVS
jgi:hypothetical protein